jgi:predicted SnoaL-like aldol condensation-catalyzing enzyme
MVTASHASLVQRVTDEIWNAGNIDVADELFGARYINHGGLIPDLVRGPECVKFSVALFRKAFPDLHLCVDDLRPDGEMVTVHWTVRGTRTDVGGPSDTDTAGALTGETTISVAGGQIVESWTSWNSAEVLEGLGIFERADDETS